jgi:putative endonuclease
MGLFYFMAYHTYIIYSLKLDKFYIGHTEELEIRLTQHNSGISTFTAKASDWQLVYSEHYETRELARKREMEIKKKKSRKYIEWLIETKSLD